MRFTQIISIFLLLSLMHTQAIAQIVGGFKNGQSVPSEVGASTLTDGGFSGDVSLFSGTYNSSYTLGTVSTISGLSFTATLSYASSFTTGDNLPQTSGIPYGEGWSLNLPQISVSTEDYQKYTAWQEYQNNLRINMNSLSEGALTKADIFDWEGDGDCSAVKKEGELYWFKPMLSIPGGPSGRLIHKYSKGLSHYFTLAKFQDYVEVIYDGDWEVILSDGTRYEMSTWNHTYKNPTNRRVDQECITEGPNEENPSYASNLANLVLPKYERTVFYCTGMYNRGLVGHITFSYDTYGQFDFHKVYNQPEYLRAFQDQNMMSGYTSPNGSPRPNSVGYRDVFLTGIRSEQEKLVLEYERIGLSGAVDVLDPADPAVEMIDDLYAKRTIYSNANDLDEWMRYKHLKGEDLCGAYDITATNPYVGLNKNGGEGQVYFRELSGATSNSADFNHGFLESPDIPTANFIPGDLYEVRSTIKNPWDSRQCLFDINIASGDRATYDPSYPDPEKATGQIAREYMDKSRGTSIFTTFNQAVKWWNTADELEHEMNTSNFFVMPNLPSAFDNLNIQIGPANSDTKFNKQPNANNLAIAISDNQNVSIKNTYFYNQTPNNQAITTGQSVPNNFGIGLPWYMMADFYGNVDGLYDFLNPPVGGAFWWNYCGVENGVGHYYWENYPTATNWSGSNGEKKLKLGGVEIVRYSKIPLMLKTVKKYIYNGGDDLSVLTNGAWTVVKNVGLDYDIVNVDRYVTKFGAGENCPTSQLAINGKRNIVRLKNIFERPHTESNNNCISCSTTYFDYYDDYNEAIRTSYGSIECFDESSQTSGIVHNVNFVLLKNVTSPLGKKTTIVYNDELTPAYDKFSYRPRHSEMDAFTASNTVKQGHSYALQYNKIVSELKVQDQSYNGDKVYFYDFEGYNLYNDYPSFSGQFTHDRTSDFKHGFAQTIVTGPAGAARNSYRHHTDKKLWGMLFSSESFDEDGVRYSSSDTEYEAILAFEAAHHRKTFSGNAMAFDYEEYHNENRPFIEDSDFSTYSQYINAIVNYNASGFSYFQEEITSYYNALSQEPNVECINATQLSLCKDSPIQSLPLADQLICYDFYYYSTGFEIVDLECADPELHCDCFDNQNLSTIGQEDCSSFFGQMDSWYENFNPNSIDNLSCDCDNYSNLTQESREACNQYFQEFGEVLNHFTDTFIEDIADLASMPRLIGFYESELAEDIEINGDPEYLNSYFIRKNNTTQTSYDNPCKGAGNMSMTTNTQFEYFDADYKGSSTSSGYAALGIDGSALDWEPSFQLYKTTTTSPQLPGFISQEENFYLYDLINHDDYQKDPSGFDQGDRHPSTSQDNKELSLLFGVHDQRNIVFQKRTTSGSASDEPVTRSTYYLYHNEWQNSFDSYNVYRVNSPEDIDCEEEPEGDNEPLAPCLTLTQGQPIPQGYCSNSLNPLLVCQCIYDIEPVDSDGWYQTSQGGNSNGLSDNDPLANLVNIYDDPILEARAVYSTLGVTMLEKIVEQVTPSTGGNDILDMSQDLSDPIFPTGVETLTVETILERNRHGQAQSLEDEKGIITTYDFGNHNEVEYWKCDHRGRKILWRIHLRNNLGLPTKVTVGDGRDDKLVTELSYFEDNTVKSITDPNEMKVSYEYDEYDRMVEAYRNGILLQTTDYSIRQEGQDFASSANSNFVRAFSFVEEGVGFGSKSFIDPLGRKVATVSPSTYDATIKSEDNIYDIFGRVVVAKKPSLGGGATVTGGPLSPADAEFEYRPGPRSQALLSSKWGESIKGAHIISNAYCIERTANVIKEIEETGKLEGLDYITPNARFIRTETRDEDGKIAVNFTNIAGQQVASITNNGEVATVFEYDSYGNVQKVSNSEEQENIYGYNYLGQLRYKQTPDDGLTTYAYNHSGQMMAFQDANSDVRLFDYDDYGRSIAQKVSRPNQFTNYLLLNPVTDANPWIEDREYENHTNALAEARFEKQMFHEEIPQATIDAMPSGIKMYLESSLSFTKNRLVHTLSYDNVGKPVEGRFLSYTQDGFVKWDLGIISQIGIAEGKGVSFRIEYPEYNLQGSPKIQNIDLGCNQSLDFQYAYKYDSRNRIKEVYANYANTGLNGNLVASYEYDNAKGVVREKKYFDTGILDEDEDAICRNKQVDETIYTYDQRNRLTLIDSKLFDWQLFYDSNQPGGVQSSQNWNGNINGSKGTYTFDASNVSNVPDNFNAPTTYGYQYDHLNRLINADANVLVMSPEQSASFSGNAMDLGDVSFKYDEIGNIKELNRGIVVENTNAPGGQFGISRYRFTNNPGNNRLRRVDVSGLTEYNCHDQDNSFDYAYDANGNLTQDTKKGITGVEYGRSNLPFRIAMGVDECGKENQQYGNYLYDGNDQRIFKGTPNGYEYYLRDAGGREIAIFNRSKNALTWYIHGNERVAKIEHDGDIDLEDCDELLPICSDAMTGQQGVAFSSFNYVSDISEVELPTRLFRIILCDGTVRHLLSQELSQLVGNYRILQQIDIYDTEQSMVLADAQTNIYTDFEEVFTLRKGDFQYFVNGYNTCADMDCPNEFANCSDESVSAQEAVFNGIYGTIEPSQVKYPTTLVRIRLCNDEERYVPIDLLGQVPGYYTILQQYEVETSAQETSIVTTSESNGLTITALALFEGDYLFDKSLVIDGYESCVNGEPCPTELPLCDYADASQQVQELQNLQQAFQNSTTPGSFDFPTKINRIRLCNGQELHVLSHELQHLTGNYMLLQTVSVNTNSDLVEVTYDANYEGGITEDIPIANFITARNATGVYRIEGYTPCNEDSPCFPYPPECSAEEIIAQNDAMNSLVEEVMPEHTVDILMFPTNLYLVETCDGSRQYVLEQELGYVEGTHGLIQSIELTSPDQAFEVFLNGAVTNLSLQQILLIRQQGNNLLISGFGCDLEVIQGGANCEFTLEHENHSFSNIDNSTLVLAQYDQVLYQNCGNGNIEISRLSKTQQLDFNTKLGVSTLSSDPLVSGAGFLRSLLLTTAYPTGEIEVDLNPATVLTSYPGLSNQINTSYLIFDINYISQFTNTVSTVINYAVEQWASSYNFTETTFDFEIEVDANNGLVYIYTSIFHNPDVAYISISPDSFSLHYSSDGVNTVVFSDRFREVLRTYEAANIGSILEVPCAGWLQMAQTVHFESLQTNTSWEELPLGTPDIRLNPKGGSNSGTCQDVEDTLIENCGPPLALGDGETYTPCIRTTQGDIPDLPEQCPEEDVTELGKSLRDWRIAGERKTARDLSYPVKMSRIRFCTGTEVHVLGEETGGIRGSFEVLQTIVIKSPDQKIMVSDGERRRGASVDDVLSRRLASGTNIYLEGYDPGVLIATDDDIVRYEGDPFNKLSSMSNPPIPNFSFYINDHLGNTRIVYNTTFKECQDFDVTYTLEHVVDYYPFGKVLREYIDGKAEKFLTTNHERDIETGLDYRGARFYDSDLGRFLSVDPLAADFAGWSPYSYVFNNPLSFVDLDGMKPTPSEAALIAAHVYGDGNYILEGGWKPSNANISNVKYADKASSFSSNLYERDLGNGKKEYVYATAGTTGDDMEDWANNYAQGTGGNAPQYQLSTQNAEAINASLNGEELTFVGHSLGGGLASANALKTGNDAITFNAAGLHPKTKQSLGLNKNAHIDAFVIIGEVLTEGQRNANGLVAEGSIHYLNPRNPVYSNQNSLLDTFKEILTLKSARESVNNHSINEFIKLLE